MEQVSRTADKRPRGRILVVEDEAYVRDSLGDMLRSRGFDVHLAATAEAKGV